MNSFAQLMFDSVDQANLILHNDDDDLIVNLKSLVLCPHNTRILNRID